LASLRVGADLRPQDIALLSVDAELAPRILVCSGNYDAWTTVGCGGSREEALVRAREHLGRGFAFTVSRSGL
jgi:hypothetical protein